MGADLLIKEDIVFGNRVEVIALCSKVEVKQNFSTTGSYREVYYLNGKDGAYISGIIFKMVGADAVDVEVFTDTPVLVKGTVGEYRGVHQILIESVTPLTDVLDKNDLLAEMVDTSILDTINDILYAHQCMYPLSFKHLRPAIGLEESTAGTFALRMLKFLQIGMVHYPEQTREYIDNFSLLAEYFLDTEGTLMDRITLVKAADSAVVQAVLFNAVDQPEYEEFTKLHHLIMKPRGCVLEIMDHVFGNHSSGGGDIH